MNAPTNLVFIDSNILVYAHDPTEGSKYDTAVAILKDLWRNRAGVLSTQVLQEFYSVATRKLKPVMPKREARARVAEYSEWCSIATDPQLIVSASILDEKHELHWWGAMIIEAAMRSGATTLLSEDMQHGQKFGELTVRNPFVEAN